MEKTGRSCKIVRHTDSLLRQALRYCGVAAAGFVSDYAVLVVLKEICGLHYLLAAAIGFIVGCTVNYLAGIWFVFRRSRLPRALELTGFLLISVAALGLTELTLYLLTDLLGVHYLLSRICAGLVTYLFNFLMRRYVLYRSPASKSDRDETSQGGSDL